MESHAQSVEDHLIDSLSFKLKPGASYVTDRRSVTFFPDISTIRGTSPPERWVNSFLASVISVRWNR